MINFPERLKWVYYLYIYLGGEKARGGGLHICGAEYFCGFRSNPKAAVNVFCLAAIKQHRFLSWIEFNGIGFFSARFKSI